MAIFVRNRRCWLPVFATVAACLSQPVNAQSLNGEAAFQQALAACAAEQAQANAILVRYGRPKFDLEELRPDFSVPDGRNYGAGRSFQNLVDAGVAHLAQIRGDQISTAVEQYQVCMWRQRIAQLNGTSSGRAAAAPVTASRGAVPSPAPSAAISYQAARTAVAQGKWELAVQRYTEAVAADPGNMSYRIERGLQYMNTGQADAALKDFSEAIRLSPNNPSGYYYRGKLYEVKGQIALAYADAQKAQQLAPGDANARAWTASLASRLAASQQVATTPPARTASIPLNGVAAQMFGGRGIGGGLIIRPSAAAQPADPAKTFSVDPVTGAPCGSMTGVTEAPFAKFFTAYTMHFENRCDKVLVIHGERIPNGEPLTGDNFSSTGIPPGSRTTPAKGTLICISGAATNAVFCRGWKRGWVTE